MRPLVPAKCIDCGYVGKSKRPRFYQCGHCYYVRMDAANMAQIEQLTGRIKKLRVQAAKFRIKSVNFRLRHPMPPIGEI